MIEIIEPLLKNTKSILDIGTGTGDLARAIKTEGTVTGLDISNDMLKVAREKSQDGCFVQGDAYKLPFNDKIYDAVTYKYALHHLDQPIKALTEAFRVLKDNGCIIIADVASFEEEANHLIFNKLNSPPSIYKCNRCG
jgi:demethylmenaquinone methyltransferase/2-methoxy-6-polyprenyl-1,4-benzoquinol methylase